MRPDPRHERERLGPFSAPFAPERAIRACTDAQAGARCAPPSWQGRSACYLPPLQAATDTREAKTKPHGRPHPTLPRRRQKEPLLPPRVTDHRAPRGGRFLEKIGTFDPAKKDLGSGLLVDLARLDYWRSHGATPSETVERLLKAAAKIAAAAKPA